MRNDEKKRMSRNSETGSSSKTHALSFYGVYSGRVGLLSFIRCACSSHSCIVESRVVYALIDMCLHFSFLTLIKEFASCL